MGENGLLQRIEGACWVRLTTDTNKGVPKHLRGLDAVVLEAPTKRHEGGAKDGDHSPSNYESQPKDTVFRVRVRDTGDLLELKRSAFAAISQDRGGLVGAMMED